MNLEKTNFIDNLNEEENYRICEVCGKTMTELKCKIKCEKCGYFRSCSDLY